jgi:cation:H+ antiporter
LLPLGLYGLYLFLHQQDLGLGAQPDNVLTHEDGTKMKQWSVMLACLLVLVAGCEGLVRSAIFFGDTFGIPSFILGFTALAAITSYPDTALSVISARKGDGDRSLANVLGSNIFDLCVCIPAGILIAGTAAIDLANAVPMMALLVVATLIVFFMARTDLRLTRFEGLVLLALYGLFIVFIFGESSGVTNFLNTR